MNGRVGLGCGSRGVVLGVVVMVGLDAYLSSQRYRAWVASWQEANQPQVDKYSTHLDEYREINATHLREYREICRAQQEENRALAERSNALLGEMITLLRDINQKLDRDPHR